MSLFNLDWFKTRKKQNELLDLQIKKEALITEAIQKDMQEREAMQRGTIVYKPYKKVKFVNNVLTVVLNDGSVINKSEATVPDFIAIRDAADEGTIIRMMRTDVLNPVQDEGEKDISPSYDLIHSVLSFPDFEKNEECIYMNGIDRSLPPLLVSAFGKILESYDKNSPGWEERVLNDPKYSSLKKFWLKCCLNPNAQSAEDLYTFLSYHNLKIDRHGNFFAYRRVVKVGSSRTSNDKLVNLISTAYNNVKAVWKKKPCNFRIEELDGVHSLHKITSQPKGAIVGNLDTLYNNLPNMTENRYTDAHTRSMDYRVGEIASIPRNQCNDDNSVNCSRGLHAASKKYDYTGFGDTPVLMIINPMDAVAVPLGEVGKLRVSRWFFAMTLDEKDKYILDDEDFDVTELGDIFEEKCLKNIEEHVHQSFAEEVKRHTFTIPQMSNKTIRNISEMLKDMNDVVKNRIVRQ